MCENLTRIRTDITYQIKSRIHSMYEQVKGHPLVEGIQNPLYRSPKEAWPKRMKQVWHDIQQLKLKDIPFIIQQMYQAGCRPLSSVRVVPHMKKPKQSPLWMFTIHRPLFRHVPQLDKHVHQLFHYFGQDLEQDGAKALLSIENKLFKHRPSPEVLSSIVETYNICHSIPTWCRLLLFNPEEKQVVFDAPSAYEHIQMCIKNLPLEAWRLFLSVHWLLFHSQFFSHSKHLIHQFKPNQLHADYMTDHLLGMWPQVSSFFYNQHLKDRIPDLRKHMRQVESQIKKGWHKILPILFPHEQTRKKAQKKLQQCAFYVIGPRVKIPKKKKLEKSLFIDQIYQKGLRNMERSVKKKVTPAWYTFGSFDFNAFYSPFENKILIPVALIDYFLKQPDTMAGLGRIIGHEIGHMFDRNGRYITACGTLQDWWQDPSAIRLFNRLKRKVGHLQVSEVWSDLLGMLAAYEAWQQQQDLRKDPQTFWQAVQQSDCGKDSTLDRPEDPHLDSQDRIKWMKQVFMEWIKHHQLHF